MIALYCTYVHHMQKAQLHTAWWSKATVVVQHQLPHAAPLQSRVNYSPLRWTSPPASVSSFSLHLVPPFVTCSLGQIPEWLQSELAGWCLSNQLRGAVGAASCQHGCPAATQGIPQNRNFTKIPQNNEFYKNRRHFSRDNRSRLEAEQGTWLQFFESLITTPKIRWVQQAECTNWKAQSAVVHFVARHSFAVRSCQSRG